MQFVNFQNLVDPEVNNLGFDRDWTIIACLVLLGMFALLAIVLTFKLRHANKMILNLLKLTAKDGQATTSPQGLDQEYSRVPHTPETVQEQSIVYSRNQGPRDDEPVIIINHDVVLSNPKEED